MCKFIEEGVGLFVVSNDKIKVRRELRKMECKIVGKGWFDMKVVEYILELCREMCMFKFCGVYDLKCFYKNVDIFRLSTYF